MHVGNVCRIWFSISGIQVFCCMVVFIFLLFPRILESSCLQKWNAICTYVFTSFCVFNARLFIIYKRVTSFESHTQRAVHYITLCLAFVRDQDSMRCLYERLQGICLMYQQMALYYHQCFLLYVLYVFSVNQNKNIHRMPLRLDVKEDNLYQHKITLICALEFLIFSAY